MNSGTNFQKVAFLDTNTLHYLGLYLDYAQKLKLFPFGKTDAEVAAACLGREDQNEVTVSRRRGFTVIETSLKRSLRIEYTPVSELELLVGRIKGEAIKKAAEEGIPDRIYSRFYEDEIRQRTTTPELTQIKKRVENLATALAKLGVAKSEEDPYSVRDVMQLAKGINGLIYIEAMDSLIYASALLAGADYLFTSDRHFKEVVNGIGDAAPKPQYQNVQKDLRQLVESLILNSPQEIELPKAYGISRQGNWEPTLP